jgi:hypothetical protein
MKFKSPKYSILIISRGNGKTFYKRAHTEKSYVLIRVSAFCIFKKIEKFFMEVFTFFLLLKKYRFCNATNCFKRKK